MKVSEAQYQDFVKAENAHFLAGLMSNDGLVIEIIPIYTKKNPHPTRKRPEDCPIEVTYKQGLRMLMLRELSNGGDRTAIIEKYKQKVEQL